MRASSFRVVFDARPALRQRTGVGVYVAHLLEAMSRLPEAPQLLAWTTSRKDPPLQLGGNPERLRCQHDRFPVRLVNLLWHRLQAPAIERLVGPQDLCHSPTPLLIPTRKARRAITVHDLYFLRHPEHTYAEIRRDYSALVRRHAGQADLVLCVSEYTRGQVLELLTLPPERVHTTPLGVDPRFFLRVAPPDAPLPPYLLALGTKEPRKNPQGILRGFAAASSLHRAGVRLLFVGPLPDAAAGARLRDLTVSLGIADRVDFRDYVSADDLPGLYQGALGLVFPSLDEGFGLPIVEAMASSIPVLTSNRAAMREVADDAALLIDPEQPDEIGAGLERMVEDSALRRRLIEAGERRARAFTWSQTAEKTLAAYRQTLALEPVAGTT